MEDIWAFGIMIKKNNLPGQLKKEIFPKFNRAVIFDTSQNSMAWSIKTN